MIPIITIAINHNFTHRSTKLYFYELFSLEKSFSIAPEETRTKVVHKNVNQKINFQKFQIQLNESYIISSKANMIFSNSSLRSFNDSSLRSAMHYQVKLILNFLDTSISKLDTNIHLPRNKDKNVHKYEVREKKDNFL